MTDSENSIATSPATERGLLSVTAVWLTNEITDVSREMGAVASKGRDDRVLSLWLDWIATRRKVEELCRKQQRLERCLVSAVGFPRVDVLRPGGERTVAAFTTSEIDTLLGGGTATADERKKAKSVLLARQKAWNAMDNRLGYSSAKRAEIEAEVDSEKLANALWAEPAGSIAGIVAKLHAVLLTCEEDGTRDEPPWPQIRSILVDLIDLDNTATAFAP